MFYIFHGENEHTQKETLAQLMTRLGDQTTLDLNTVRFSGLIPLSSLRQAAETLPFLAPARVVIVENLLLSKPDKEYLQELVDFLVGIPETTRLIFLESQTLRDNHPLILLARQQEHGIERVFSLPEGNQIVDWIERHAERKGGDISNQAAHLLASLVGNNLQILDNEIEKLVAYKSFDEPRIIMPADVTLLSPYVAEVSIFDVVDAIGNRDEQKATSLYQRKLDEGADAFYLFSMFVRQFRLMIQVKELALSGYNPPAIARELRLHDFVVGKIYRQAQGFSMEELELIYRHLLDVDVAVKNGKADIRVALDLLVATLTIAP